MANVTITTGANFIPELWSLEILESSHKNTVMANLVCHHYAKAMKLGDIFHIPNLYEIAAASKAAGTDVTYTANTEAVTNITVNQHYYAAVKIEDIVEVQANQSMRGRYTTEIGRAVAEAIDDNLAALIDDVAQTVGTLAVDITDDNVIRAVQYLDDGDAPQDNRYFAISPACKANLLKIDKFVHGDYKAAIGGVAAGKGRGYFGNIYGLDVYVSSNVEGTNAAGHDNGIFHEESMALVMQQDVKTVAEYSVDSLAWKLAAHAIWGSGLLSRGTTGTTAQTDPWIVWVKGP